MNKFISVLFFYNNKGEKIQDESLLNMETVFLVCDDSENGLEFRVECVEQENRDEYSLQILVDEWLFKGIEKTLRKPTKAIIGTHGEELEIDVNRLSVIETVELYND